MERTNVRERLIRSCPKLSGGSYCSCSEKRCRPISRPDRWPTRNGVGKFYVSIHRHSPRPDLFRRPEPRFPNAVDTPIEQGGEKDFLLRILIVWLQLRWRRRKNSQRILEDTPPVFSESRPRFAQALKMLTTEPFFTTLLDEIKRSAHTGRIQNLSWSSECDELLSV